MKKIKCLFGFHKWGVLTFTHATEETKHTFECCVNCKKIRAIFNG